MQVLKLGLFILFTASEAQAQVASLSLLADAKAKVEKDLAQVTKDYNAERMKTDDYDACRFVQLGIQKAYDEWFIKNLSHFKKLSDTIDSTLAQANAKLEALKGNEITVNPLPGQTTYKKVTFQDLIQFFKIYNARLKSCTKDNKAQLMRDMENPEKNILELGQSQIEDAMSLMTTNLNASLRDSGSSYEIAMSRGECSFNLELKVKVDMSGVKQSYNFPLIDEKGGANTLAKIELGEAAKWAALVKSNSKINGLPVDGLLRYRLMQEKMKESCQNLPKFASYRSGLPFLTYAEAKKLGDDLAKRGVINEAIEMEFVTVEPGTFQMGSPGFEAGRYSNEQQHTVTLTRSFEIQTTEVTQKQWFAIMGSNPSQFKSKNHCSDTYSTEGGGMCPNHPVENVNWDDVQSFIQKLNAKQDGYQYRLPSEAEWEYAARGGLEGTKQSTVYAFGNDTAKLADYAWFDQNSSQQTQDAAKKESNTLGLYDMHGNVWEWCSDRYGDYSGTQSDPEGPASGSNRVLRGGSWGDGAQNLRSANRGNSSPGIRDSSFGFRLVRTFP